MAATTTDAERASQILEDQIIHVKRGRLQGFGFEPAWNAYFDFYVSPKYIDPPLLRLEDVTFHLFLRKNLNDRNPEWRMPSIRQMMRRLSVSQVKLTSMMERLDHAKLLEKISGFRRGEDGENIPNHYVLSDPIQTFDEFMAVALAGTYTYTTDGKTYGVLRKEWQEYYSTPCIENQYTPYLLSIQPPVSEINTYKQTSFKKQDMSYVEKLWLAVLDTLRLQLPSATFYSFVADTQLIALENQTATLELPNPSAKDWIESRLSNQIKQLLYVEGKMIDGEMKSVKELIVVVRENNVPS